MDRYAISVSENRIHRKQQTQILQEYKASPKAGKS